MNAGFDMQIELARLAERIVGPIAAKLAQNELDTVVGQIRCTFEQLSTKIPPANVDYEKRAINILEPVRAKLSEADFTRIVDRLGGAMSGFCQRDEAKVKRDAEPSRLQQAGQRETLHLQQHAKSVPDAEPWWSTSEQAMALLILLWLYTEINWQLR